MVNGRPEVRDEDGGDADGVVDDLAFGESGGGIEDLVEVGETELAADDFDDGGSGHRWLVVGYMRRNQYSASPFRFLFRIDGWNAAF